MKKLLTLFILLLLILSSALPSYAADGKVTYSGNAGSFIFAPGSNYSPTDLFPNFKDIMPGDTLAQKITVKNNAASEVKVKIYLRALGAHENSIDFLSKLGLKVKKSSDNNMAYMFDAAADQSAQLTDWVCLGTLYSGGTVNLDVLLNVPTDLDNEYQNKIGYLDWEFKIEEFPIDDTDPQPPKTGYDLTNFIWVGLMFVSLFMIIILLVTQKKIRKKRKR